MRFSQKGVNKTYLALLRTLEKKFKGTGFWLCGSYYFPKPLIIISPKCGSQSDILGDNAQFKS